MQITDCDAHSSAHQVKERIAVCWTEAAVQRRSARMPATHPDLESSPNFAMVRAIHPFILQESPQLAASGGLQPHMHGFPVHLPTET